MIKENNPRLIGLFVIGSVALIIIVFLVFGSGEYFKEKSTYVIYFRSSTGGLSEGASIKVRGVKIGEVKKITPYYMNNEELVVEVIMETDNSVIKTFGNSELGPVSEEELNKLIGLGLRAQLETGSLVTGQLYIKIDYFPNSESILTGYNDQYPEIPSLLSPMDELGKNIDQSIQEFSQIRFAQISTSLIRSLNAMDSLLRAPEIRGTLRTLNQSLLISQSTMQNADTRLDTLSKAIILSSQSANAMLQDAEKLLTNINDITTANRYDLNEALKEMIEASQALANLADLLQRHPEAILKGKD